MRVGSWATSVSPSLASKPSCEWPAWSCSWAVSSSLCEWPWGWMESFSSSVGAEQETMVIAAAERTVQRLSV